MNDSFNLYAVKVCKYEELIFYFETELYNSIRNVLKIVFYMAVFFIYQKLSKRFINIEKFFFIQTK